MTEYLIGAAIGLVIGLAVGFILLKVKTKESFNKGVEYRKSVAEEAIGSAEAEAARLVSEGEKQGEARKRDLLLEAREEIRRIRGDIDAEIREKKSEMQRAENRLNQRE